MKTKGWSRQFDLDVRDIGNSANQESINLPEGLLIQSVTVTLAAQGGPILVFGVIKDGAETVEQQEANIGTPKKWIRNDGGLGGRPYNLFFEQRVPIGKAKIFEINAINNTGETIPLRCDVGGEIDV